MESTVLMFHPTAWDFPEADLVRTVVGVPGKERDPMHGWYHQRPRNADSEMEDVTFAYKLVRRGIPQNTVKDITTGNLPEWLQSIADLRADTGCIDKFAVTAGLQWNLQTLLSAGLVNAEDVYVDVAEVSNTRLIEPDLLAIIGRETFFIRGIDGLRSCLRTVSGSVAPITPGQVEVMAFQLGIAGRYHLYWFALFALSYPLAPAWTYVVTENTRMYVSLESGQSSRIHPLLDQLGTLLSDWEQSEILFDVRGSLKSICDECSKPDAVLLCTQCSDMFCPSCYVKVHARRSHTAIPMAGCRYLSLDEVSFLGPRIHVTNVGFCNRRRFLARTNQSDKTGPCLCQWLHFDSETAFDSVYTGQTPERSCPKSGFFYNFETKAIAIEAAEFTCC